MAESASQNDHNLQQQQPKIQPTENNQPSSIPEETVLAAVAADAYPFKEAPTPGIQWNSTTDMTTAKKQFNKDWFNNGPSGPHKNQPQEYNP